MGLSTEDVDGGMMFSNATIENFSKCTVSLLKSFVHVREFTTAVIPKAIDWHWPKKVELTQIAFDRRS